MLNEQRMLKLKRLLTYFGSVRERSAMLYEMGVPEYIIFQHSMEGAPHSVATTISLKICKEPDVQQSVETYIDNTPLPDYIKT